MDNMEMVRLEREMALALVEMQEDAYLQEAEDRCFLHAELESYRDREEW
jgi:hypothetical protein